MKLSFNIVFSDGSNPWYYFPREANEAIKEVKRWYKNR